MTMKFSHPLNHEVEGLNGRPNLGDHECGTIATHTLRLNSKCNSAAEPMLLHVHNSYFRPLFCSKIYSLKL